MGVQIRSAGPEDRSRCLDLLQMLRSAAGGQVPSTAGAAFDELLAGQRGQILVADHGGKLLGFASVTYNLAMRYGGDYCQLEELIVDPDARGMNVGGQLVEAVLQTARRHGCAECGLYLLPTTAHNRPFYERFGFLALDVEMRQSLGQDPAA